MYLGNYFLNKIYRSFILIALVHFKANFSQKTEEKGDFQCQNWNWKIQSCTHTFQTYLLSTYYILYIPSKVFFPCYYLCVTCWSLRGRTICTENQKVKIGNRLLNWWGNWVIYFLFRSISGVRTLCYMYIGIFKMGS